jgi:hypothetical protein
MQIPLVSCLCVTENRPAFMPWLTWNFAKQDHAQRELVIVDSSDVPAPLPDDPAVTVVRCARGTSVAQKRNVALASARGTFVTWFDDDDWQHPRKLSLLVDKLGDDGAIAGGRRAWFVDLRRARARPYESQRMVLFTGSGFRHSALGATRFDERKVRAADTAWLKALIEAADAPPRDVSGILTWWLCHDRNISNPATRYVFPQTLRDVRNAVGEEDWGDTDSELALLAERLDRRTLEA